MFGYSLPFSHPVSLCWPPRGPLTTSIFTPPCRLSHHIWKNSITEKRQTDRTWESTSDVNAAGMVPLEANVEIPLLSSVIYRSFNCEQQSTKANDHTGKIIMSSICVQTPKISAPYHSIASRIQYKSMPKNLSSFQEVMRPSVPRISVVPQENRTSYLYNVPT